MSTINTYHRRSSLCLAVAALACLGASAPCDAATQVWQPLLEPGCGGRTTSVTFSPYDASRILVGGDMLGINLSTDAGNSWQDTFGLRGYEIGSITWHPTDPNTVWAGTMSGPYVSHDGGVNWTPARSGLPAIDGGAYSAPVENVLFDPNDASHLLAFGGSNRRWKPTSNGYGKVWQSSDGGQTWSQKSTLTAAGTNIVAATYAAGSSSVLYAGVNGQGFYYSDDGGGTWTQRNGTDQAILPHTQINRVVADPTNLNTVYVALDSDNSTSTIKPGGVFKSTDGGLTWTGVNNGLAQNVTTDKNTTARYTGLAISAADPSVLVTTDRRYGGAGGIYQTQNGGDTWTKFVPAAGVYAAYPGVEPVGEVVTIDPTDKNKTIMGGTNHLLEATVTGETTATWTDLASQAVPSTGGFIGTGYSGLVAANIAFSPFDANHVMLQAMDGGKLWQSKDGMLSWQRTADGPVFSNSWGGGKDAVFASSTVIYATLGQSNFQGIARSTDNGSTWQRLEGAARGLPGVDTGSSPGGIYSPRGDPQKVWAVVNNVLYASTDGGDSWSQVPSDKMPLESGEKLGWIAGDPASPNTFYVSSSKSVWRTTDGVTFTAIASQTITGPKQGPARMVVDSEHHLLLVSKKSDASSGEGLWEGEMVGTTWTWKQVWKKGYARDIAVDPTDPYRMALVTDDTPYHDEMRADGVWLSLDGGVKWEQINDGLPMLRGSAIEFNPYDPDQLIVGTGGAGFFTYTIPEPASILLLAAGAAVTAGLRARRRRAA